MKKPLLLYATIALFAPALHSQDVINILTGEKAEAGSTTQPICQINKTDNGIEVTYYFENIRIDSVTSGNEAFKLRFDGFGVTTSEGEPYLPCRTDPFKVAVGTDVSLEVINTEYSEYFFELAPADIPMPQIATTRKKNTINTTSGFYPESNVYLDYLQPYTAEDNLYGVCIYPVTYDHQNKTVRILNSITYRVSRSESLSNVTGSRINTLSLDNNDENGGISLLSDNNEIDIDKEKQKIEMPGKYLILTTPKFKESVSSFAEWKKCLGFETKVIYSNSWTTDSIIECIDEYFISSPAPLHTQYLLIVGTHDDVPAMKRMTPEIDSYPSTEFLTDRYYGNLMHHHTLNAIQDVHTGRIPASTDEEAAAAFSKIEAYESATNFNPDIFKRALFCGYFEDNFSKDGSKVPDGIEDVPYIQTLETIISLAKENEVTPIRVYQSSSPNSEITPSQFYNKGILPNEITSSDFNWHGKPLAIPEALENGVHYVVYNGHGVNRGWIAPSYSTFYIENENYGATSTKDGLYPVVFSMTCQTGKFSDPNCFAAKSITQPHGGSSAIIAASEISWTYMNSELTEYLFKSLYQCYYNPISGIRLPLYRIGSILSNSLSGLVYDYRNTATANSPMLDNTLDIYHCFGDPSMMIHTEEPKPFDNVTLVMDKNTKTWTVDTGEGPAYISFYDKTTGKVQCEYTDHSQFQFAAIHQAVHGSEPTLTGFENLVISAPNRIPYIANNWLQPGNSDLSHEVKAYMSDDTIYFLYKCQPEDQVVLHITNVTSGANELTMECDPTKGTAAVYILSLPVGTHIATLEINGVITHKITFNNNKYSSKN